MELPQGNGLKSMDEIMREHFLSVWEFANGKICKVTRILKCSRSTTYRWAKQYGVLNA